ncbi:MAG: hypothetical protein LBG27_09085 [Spirochaetaceae bacterium]|jgi:putative aldouronate transport system permease protein|nr:hypothetical protein [Spirochaetaceae bacterium]
MEKLIVALKTAEGHKKIGAGIVRYKYLYILFLPVAVWYLLFCYIPMYGIVIAFKNYNVFDGIGKSPWVGFTYFQALTPPKIPRLFAKT